MDHFKHIYPSELGYRPSFTYLVAVSAPMMGFQIVTFFVLDKIPLQCRITLTFFINMVMTVCILFIPNYMTGDDLYFGYVLTLVAAGIYGASVAIL